MRLDGTRFGNIDIDESRAIDMPRGLIGFPEETKFVLLEPAPGRKVAWLQSMHTPALAFPVVDGATIGEDYPNPSAPALARDAAIIDSADSDVSVLVIVSAREAQKNLVANVLAPIVVDLGKRQAAQVVLDPRKYSAARPLDRVA